MNTYDLVSHGTDTSGTNQCYGEWNEPVNAGWGPGFQNSCIHSDSNEHSGGDTVWYNYTIASAGTIFDENTTQENPANNTIPATESICPKGWTLPSRTQISSIGDGRTTYISAFSPVLGGNYLNSELKNEDSRGRYWGSEADTGVLRGNLGYSGNYLSYNNNLYHIGFYIRCVVKKNTKTLSNLTYMQDMTFWP